MERITPSGEEHEQLRAEFARKYGGTGISWDHFDEWEQEQLRLMRGIGPTPATTGHVDKTAGYGGAGYGTPGYGAPGYGGTGSGAPGYGTPGYGAPGYGPAMTKKELVELPQLSKVKSTMKSAAIVTYVCAGISLIAALAMENYTSLLDVAVLIALGLGIQLKYSRGCAIALLIYSIVNVIAFIAIYNQLGGYLVVVAGVYAVSATGKLEKVWKEYQRSGNVMIP